MHRSCPWRSVCAWAALAAIVLGALGCGGGRHAPPDDTLVIALGANPTNLDPRFATDAFSVKIDALIFSSLLQRDQEGALASDLAQGIEALPESRFRVTLRPGVLFHDGSVLDAHDVVATYQALADPELGSVKRLPLAPITAVEAEGDLSVLFTFNGSFAAYRELLTIPIVPLEHVRNPDFGEQLIGSGPFRFVSRRADEHVTLRRFDEWYGGQAGVENLEFRIIPDATVRVLEVLHGSADLTQNDIPLHTVNVLAERPSLEVSSAPSRLVKYVCFNLEHPILGRREVRRAIALAIDRPELVHYKLRGYGTPTATFLHPSTLGYNGDLAVRERDLDAAAALLDAAGFPDPDGDGPLPRFSLEWRTSLDEGSIAVAQVIRRQLAELGIDMEIRTNEWGVFYSAIKRGEFELYSLTGVGINDPDWFAWMVHSDALPPGGANRGRYLNPELDALLDRGKTELDDATRAATYRRVQEILWQDLPLLPLWYDHNVVVHGPRVSGYELTPNGMFRSLVNVQLQAAPQ